MKNHHECPQEKGDNKRNMGFCAQFTDEENRFKRGRVGHTFSPQISLRLRSAAVSCGHSFLASSASSSHVSLGEGAGSVSRGYRQRSTSPPRPLALAALLEWPPHPAVSQDPPLPPGPLICAQFILSRLLPRGVSPTRIWAGHLADYPVPCWILAPAPGWARGRFKEIQPLLHLQGS